MATISTGMVLVCVKCRLVPQYDQVHNLSSCESIRFCERCSGELDKMQCTTEKICPHQPVTHDTFIKTKGVEGELQKFCPVCCSKLITKSILPDPAWET